jgi:hypothetical protein
MIRPHWTVLVVLAAVGCVAGEGWHTGPGTSGSPPSDLDREVREGLEMAEQLPPPGERTGNVTMVVEKILVDRTDRINLEAAWRFVSENAVVSGGRIARRNGLRIGVATDGFRGALRAALEKSRTKQVEKLLVTSLTGTRGTITVGRDLYVPVLRYRTPRGDVVLLKREFVGGSLVAVPEILPDDRVRVELYPSFRTREGREIELAEMATEVVTRHGRPLVIGGLDRSTEDVGSALFSWTRERGNRRVVLTVTPHVQGAPPP